MRMFTVIVESLIFPVVAVEAEYSNFIINANVGGGFFLLFGLLNTIETQGIFIPELTLSYRMNDWFQIGTGVNLFMWPEASGDTDTFGYIPTVFCRFNFGD